MTLEDKVLHCFARVDMDNGTLERFEKLASQPVQWDRVVALALDNDLAPLLHHHLQKINRQIPLPEEAPARLRREYMETMARNILFQDELVKLLKAFSEHGIEAIALKGAALLNGVYPKVALRPMSDLDLLIHREDLERIETLAEPLGYGVDHAEDLQEGYGREFRSEETLLRRGSMPLRVELHWQLLNFGDEIETLKDVWSSAISQKFENAEAKVLGPEHLVIYLAEHLAYHHNLDGLLRYCDVAEVLRYYEAEIDWERLALLAQRGKSLLAVKTVLQRACEMLDAPVPSEAMVRLESVKPSLLDKIFYRMATNENLATTARALMDFMAIRGAWRRFRFVAAKFFPSRKCLTNRWPVRYSWMVYLWYPRRWGQMIWRGVRGARQLVRYLVAKR